MHYSKTKNSKFLSRELLTNNEFFSSKNLEKSIGLQQRGSFFETLQVLGFVKDAFMSVSRIETCSKFLKKKYLKSITVLQFTDEAKYKKRSMGSHILLIECEIVVAINWKFNREVDLK